MYMYICVRKYIYVCVCVYVYVYVLYMYRALRGARLALNAIGKSQDLIRAGGGGGGGGGRRKVYHRDRRWSWGEAYQAGVEGHKKVKLSLV